MTNTLTTGAAFKPARQISPTSGSPAFAGALVNAKRGNLLATDKKKKDGMLPPIDRLAAANNILHRVPSGSGPVRLAVVLPDGQGVIYRAEWSAGGVTLNSASAVGHPMDGHTYRVIPGATPAITVNGILMNALPEDQQDWHLYGLRHAGLISEVGGPVNIVIHRH